MGFSIARLSYLKYVKISNYFPSTNLSSIISSLAENTSRLPLGLILFFNMLCVGSVHKNYEVYQGLKETHFVGGRIKKS